jgi:ABC-type multidrug transport system ATPase subunit
LLPSAKYVIRILDGRIDAQGTPEDLRAQGELEGLVALEEVEVNKNEKAIVKEEVDDEVQAVEGEKSSEGNAAEDAEDDGKKKRERKKGPGKKFVQDEERPVGNVKWETYKLYIVAATYTTWAWSVLVLSELSLCYFVLINYCRSGMPELM